MSASAHQPAAVESTGVVVAMLAQRPARRPQVGDANDRLDRREALLHRLELDRQRRRGTRLTRSA